jgi:hypothetical protein
MIEAARLFYNHAVQVRSPFTPAVGGAREADDMGVGLA